MGRSSFTMCHRQLAAKTSCWVWWVISIQRSSKGSALLHLHPDTLHQRLGAVGQMIATRAYGTVTQLGHSLGVSRQSLYNWAKRGRQALEQLFGPPAAAPSQINQLDRQVLTLLVEGHCSYRGIQACLRCFGQTLSLGSIAAIVKRAQQRAQLWLDSHAPTSRRSIALDEIFGPQRGVAYLSIVDSKSWAVWTVAGPLAADSDSWTLLLWLAHDSGLRWYSAVSDGGSAMRQALRTVDPKAAHQRDVWHVLHQCSQVQARLERVVSGLREQAKTIARQVARLRAGGTALGHNPQTDKRAHALRFQVAVQTAAGLRYLRSELRRLLGVVVLREGRLLAQAGRQSELETVLALLEELAATAPASQQQELLRLHKQLRLALPQLLSFSAALEGVQQEGTALLGAQALGLLGWAWQRRKLLGYNNEELLVGLPVGWRGSAGLVLAAWEGATRASSAVEGWHSILRPHLAVHRVLSPGLLALLAVWHNHRRFERGEHAGQSPLELSGMAQELGDWLEVLGYPVPVAPQVSTSHQAAAFSAAPAA